MQLFLKYKVNFLHAKLLLTPKIKGNNMIPMLDTIRSRLKA